MLKLPGLLAGVPAKSSLQHSYSLLGPRTTQHACTPSLASRTLGRHSTNTHSGWSNYHASRAAAMASHQAGASPQVQLHEDVETMLYTEDQIKQRVQELGGSIAKTYADKEPLVLGVLTGAFTFTADLVRFMHPCPRGTQVNFVRASSYGSGSESSGQVGLKVDLDLSITKGRHVVLVEDIVDTGLTLQMLKKHLLEDCQAASVAIVCMLDKQARRKVDISPDYVGFDCPDAFIVGYGLDYNESYRTLPYIGVLKPSCYQ